MAAMSAWTSLTVVILIRVEPLGTAFLQFMSPFMHMQYAKYTGTNVRRGIHVFKFGVLQGEQRREWRNPRGPSSFGPKISTNTALTQGCSTGADGLKLFVAVWIHISRAPSIIWVDETVDKSSNFFLLRVKCSRHFGHKKVRRQVVLWNAPQSFLVVIRATCPDYANETRNTGKDNLRA